MPGNQVNRYWSKEAKEAAKERIPETATATPRWATIVAALHCTEPTKDPGAAKVAMANAADYIGRMQDQLIQLERLVKEIVDDE